jgi:translation elongation factor EF-1alpha
MTANMGFKQQRNTMKLSIFVLLIAVVTPNMGCTKKQNAFDMTVQEVDALNGFILKGISISGKIENGCIAAEDEFIVKRNNKEILKQTARIVNVKNLKDLDSFDGKVFKGDYISLYIPDGKKEDVQVGDIVSSNAVSCNTTPNK